MKVLPTMTIDGFIIDPDVMLVKIFEYFLTSEYSQSVSFYSHIGSLEYILRKNGSDFNNIEKDVMYSLNNICNRYWDNVDITVNIENISNDDNKLFYNIFIDITVIVDDKKHYLSKNINIKENKIVELDNIIDYFKNEGV